MSFSLLVRCPGLFSNPAHYRIPRPRQLPLHLSLRSLSSPPPHSYTPPSSAKGTLPVVETNFKMAKILGSQLFRTDEDMALGRVRIKKLFSRSGEVTEARLIVDPKTRRPKGLGFVTYESEVEAQKALKAMYGRVIVDGRLIFVEVARTRKPRMLHLDDQS
ncbi:Splicing factor-like protein [Trema orientale]|uniref:Splicing factor-like protein n=1 Tax=Trema orientale TaxID=63057 RepID=A0A2P5A9S2_TREOI|nr:Splicing factor-like protein [Trema orientale]